jgi:hypothetical protein
MDGTIAVSQKRQRTRVARWYIFKPKIPIWVNFGVPWNGKGWYMLWPFGIYLGHLVYFWSFGSLVANLFIFHRFGKLCQEKSGNPASNGIFSPTNLICCNFTKLTARCFVPPSSHLGPML